MVDTVPPTARRGRRGAPRPSPDHVTHPVALSIVVVGLAVLLCLSMLAAVTFGPVDITMHDAWRIVADAVRGRTPPDAGPDASIVWGIRAPRAILAAVVGATLSVVGTVLQALVRNPLAEPTFLGGAAGASLGAVTVLLLGWSFAGTYSLVFAAFVGALGGYGLAFAIANRSGSLSPLRLILAGIAVSYLLAAVTNFVVMTADDPARVRSAMFWTLGSLAAAQWHRLLLPSALLVVGIVALLVRARQLDALLFGEETAASLGVEPDRFRRQLFVLVAILTGSAVALAGAIGFVGLVIPHAVRLVVGSDHGRVLPISALVGAVFLVWSDVAARMVAQPQEIPVGVVTALVGAPVFVVLLRSKLRDGAGG